MDKDGIIPEDVEIENQIIYQFIIDDYPFNVEFNLDIGEWSAIHDDEELYQDKIILETEDEPMTEDMMLFDEHEFSIEELQRMKDCVEADIEDRATNNI